SSGSDDARERRPVRMQLPDDAFAARVESDPFPVRRPGRVPGDRARQAANTAAAGSCRVKRVVDLALRGVATARDRRGVRREGRVPLWKRIPRTGEQRSLPARVGADHAEPVTALVDEEAGRCPERWWRRASTT